MFVRIDLECENGHRLNDVTVESKTGVPMEYPECSCGADMEQVYDNRKQSEGYFVMRGKNW